MISIAPTPLYLPAEEANKAVRSPIFQRKDVSSSSMKDGQQTTTTPINNSVEIEKPIINTPAIIIDNTKNNNININNEFKPFVKKATHPIYYGSLNQEQSQLIESSDIGILGSAPKITTEGLGGGVYFLSKGGKQQSHPVSVFKPKDEENGIIGPNHTIQGLKNGTMPGEGVYKEVAVYLFDQLNKGFFKVPTTTLVRIQHPLWNNNDTDLPTTKIGSLQEYVVYEDSAEGMGCSKFSTPDVHRIGLLDCLIFNCDRHTGNLLVVAKDDPQSSFDQLELIPIDHSLCLPSPDNLSDAWFDWIHFPQAKVPFTREVKEMILSMDIDKIIESLHNKLPKLRLQCLETLKITTTFVKKAIEANLTLYQIGTLMSRLHLDEPSCLEKIVYKVNSHRLFKQHHRFQHHLRSASYWNYLEKEIDLFLIDY
ncbi:hypothetical protein CYY_002300 [Polysphondylium violaceum]|uniref:PI3K/PI4K catalytic domain-containing protein n=1 Tax=Polysphondylium violaceum TaxID=133409 RepID=A0A8J4V0X4_9MYCE|nr:hypothetical protein CYY_002300 [Polysphondylium violaceum]